jgi:NAD(P)-dependent dehydrogenase (short-subunit alcohol dehydrogenase family)
VTERGALLEDRVAVVSGVGPGMGRDLSLTLAKAGADVVLAARTESTLVEVAAEVEALGRRASCVPTDITDGDDCRRVAATADAEFGRVDVLVNNAFAEDPFVSFEDGGPEVWREAFDVNVFGTLQLTQAVVPVMKQAGGGSIVMISTLSTRIVNPLLGGYASSKRGLMTAARTLATELGPYGIRVNSIAPGHIWGPSLEWYFERLAEQRGCSPEDVYDEIAGMTCLDHIHTSAEVAQVVLFFACDLSRVITGQTLDVNAGRYFH